MVYVILENMHPYLNIEEQKSVEEMLAVVLFIVLNAILIWYHVNRITIAIETHVTKMPQNNKNSRKSRKFKIKYNFTAMSIS